MKHCIPTSIKAAIARSVCVAFQRAQKMPEETGFPLNCDWRVAFLALTLAGELLPNYPETRPFLKLIIIDRVALAPYPLEPPRKETSRARNPQSTQTADNSSVIQFFVSSGKHPVLWSSNGARGVDAERARPPPVRVRLGVVLTDKSMTHPLVRSRTLRGGDVNVPGGS